MVKTSVMYIAIDITRIEIVPLRGGVTVMLIHKNAHEKRLKLYFIIMPKP